MAVLTTERRQACCQELMAELSAARELLNVNKADLQAAVNAADDYQNANALAMKQAIPMPARSAMTNSQLARMVNMVNRYRYIDGN
jgi:Ni2+-binding GTPase involved in maturation of urease and hydrogenase